MSKLGIIAGAGQLPRDIVNSCQAANKPLFVMGLEGFADPRDFTDVDFGLVNIAKAKKARQLLLGAGVTDVVFAGKVERPSLSSLKPDLLAAKFIAKIGRGFLGDDGLLKAVKKAFEDEGFKVLAVDEIFMDSKAIKGCWGIHQPGPQSIEDIKTGFRLAKGLGQLDIGQGVVMQEGLVLAAEAIEGTNRMIIRAGKLARQGERPVLVKVRKPQQDRTMDLPAVGLETVETAIAAGFAGIAVEAGSTLVVDQKAMADRANAAGFFLMGVTEEELSEL